MVVKFFTVAASTICLLLTVHSPATAQIFNPLTGDKKAKSSGVVTAQSLAEGSDDSSGVKQTSWYTLPMPKITMPKIEMPQFSMPSFWTSNDRSATSKPSIFAPLATGAKKISDGSKKAWEGAKDMFDFGREESGQRSAPKKGPSLWERMFVSKEPEGPRTVAEWMSQPRLDP